jgi:glycerol uptake facilitator-like aquaporin
MDGYDLSYTPRARYTFRDSLDEYPSNGSISDDAALNEFIGDPEFTIPVMEESFFEYGPKGLWALNQRASALQPAAHLDIEFQTELQEPKCYYWLNFATCVMVSIAVSTSILASSSELGGGWWACIFQKTQQFVMTGYVLYMVTTPDTYKSINCSLELLPINWMLYNYPFARVLLYLGIQLIAALLGAYITLGLYYSKLEAMDKKIMQRIIMPSAPHIFAIDSFALALFAHSVLAVGVTVILSPSNSINCGQTIIYALCYVYIISLLYEIAIGPVSFVIYKLALHLAYVSIFSDDSSSEKNMGWILAGAGMLFKLLGFPLIAYHVKYVWSNIARRHIEYAT